MEGNYLLSYSKNIAYTINDNKSKKHTEQTKSHSLFTDGDGSSRNQYKFKNQHCLFKITCKSLIELLNKHELRVSANGKDEKS